jgi:MFS family permease
MTTNNFWNRSFTTYLFAIAFAALADALAFVALPFLIFDITNVPKALATAIFFMALPRFLGPFIGTWVDRLQLKLPLVLMGLGRSALLATLALLAFGQYLTLTILYSLMVVYGLLALFSYAAGSVLVPQIVKSGHLARANSLIQGAMMGLPLVGYGLGGGLVANMGAATTLLIGAGCFLVFTLGLGLITVPLRQIKALKSFFGDLKEGAMYLFTQSPTLSLIMLLSFMLNAALSNLNIMIPLEMTRLGYGAKGYGLFEMIISASILLGIVLVSMIAGKLRPQLLVGLGSVLVAIGLAVLTGHSYHWYLIAASILGLGLGILEVSAVTLLQIVVPETLRGKVLGINFTANALGLSGGAYLTGQLSHFPISYVYGGFAFIVFAAALMWIVVSYRRLSHYYTNPEAPVRT